MLNAGGNGSAAGLPPVEVGAVAPLPAVDSGFVFNISLTDLNPIAAVVAMFANLRAKPKGVAVFVASSAVIP